MGNDIPVLKDDRRDRESMLVSELLNPSGYWNIPLIWVMFESKSARSILATHPAPHLGDDEIVWGETNDDIYSVKSGYYLLQSLDGSPNIAQECEYGKAFWRVFWKIKVPPRWKIFGWRILHNALSTRDNLRRRWIIEHLNICIGGKGMQILSSRR